MRVPVSIVVRMKSASNMIAKWYQYARSAFIPGRPLKTRAIPTARDTPPPVRAATTSPELCESAGSSFTWSPRRAKSASSSVVARGAAGSTP